MGYRSIRVESESGDWEWRVEGGEWEWRVRVESWEWRVCQSSGLNTQDVKILSYCSNLRIIAYSIRDISSSLFMWSSKTGLEINFWENMISSTATHSKTLPREITKNLLLSFLVNRELPSAMFNSTLVDALPSWSLRVRLKLLLEIRPWSSFTAIFDLRYTCRFWKSNMDSSLVAFVECRV